MPTTITLPARPEFEQRPASPRTLCTNCGQPAYLSILWSNSYPGVPVHAALGAGQYCHTEYAQEQVFGEAARGLTVLQIEERIATDPLLTIAHLSDEDRAAIARWRHECDEVDHRNATKQTNYNRAVAGIKQKLFGEVKDELFGPEGVRPWKLSLSDIGRVHREVARRLAEAGLA